MSGPTLAEVTSRMDFLQPYLPPTIARQQVPDPELDATALQKPYVTVTYASSLDSMLSLHPGTQTILSGPETKLMTHFLRSKHDAILVGANTAIADDPGLSCNIDGATMEHQPRPIILDPRGRWNINESSKILQKAKNGEGKAPWILTDLAYVEDTRAELLERYGGKVIPMATDVERAGEAGHEGVKFEWEDVLQMLASHGISSVMVEGGATVINTLLSRSYSALVDSVVVTIAPTFLGVGGVVVAPHRTGSETAQANVAKLADVKWQQLGEDAVVCGRLRF